MKTTIDRPEDLVREMKFRAVREGRKLRDVAEEVFRRGLAAPAPARAPGERHRVKLPIVPAPAGARPFNVTGKVLLELEQEATPFGATCQFSDPASADRQASDWHEALGEY